MFHIWINIVKPPVIISINKGLLTKTVQISYK